MQLKKMAKLSDRLKYLRAYLNLSQAELANMAGTTQQAVQQAEKGKACQPRYLHQLARELDIPVEWLVFGEMPEENNKAVPVTDDPEFSDKSQEILNNFFSMSEKDQQLLSELMKSRISKD